MSSGSGQRPGRVFSRCGITFPPFVESQKAVARVLLHCMWATRSDVLERLRNKGLSGPLQSCTLLLQMSQLDHLYSTPRGDAYSDEFSSHNAQPSEKTRGCL